MSLDVNISEPDEFNCVSLHKSLDAVAKLKKIDDYTYHVECFDGNTNNYIANIFKALIKDNNSSEVLSVIVKTLINTTRKELFHDLHVREVIFYKDIVTVSKDIQKYINKKESVLFPECLFLCKDRGNEVIISKDLSVEGFETKKKIENFVTLEFDEVKTIVEELAKFHGLSIIFKEKLPDDFEKIKPKYQDLIYCDKFLNKSKLRTYFEDSFEKSISVVTNDEARNKLCQIKGRLLDLLQYYTRPRDFNVLCHGDCWISNVLVNNQEHKICFIDFQTVRYANPMTDFIFFIYISTDSNFRQKYMKVLAEAYFNSFHKFIALFHIESNILYSLENFKRDLKDFLPFGLLAALIELRSFTNDKEISKSNFSMGCGDNLPNQESLFNFRVNDVVNECADNEVLDDLLNVLKLDLS